MNYPISKWLAVISGVIGILFGVTLLVWPGITLGLLIMLFAIYAILYGAIRIISSFTEEVGSQRRWPWMIFGILAILAGIGILFYPGVTLLIIVYYFAFYVLILGLTDIVSAFSLKMPGYEALMLLVGFLSVLLGGYLLLSPLLGLETLLMIVGWYEIVYGIFLIINAFWGKQRAIMQY